MQSGTLLTWPALPGMEIHLGGGEQKLCAVPCLADGRLYVPILTPKNPPMGFAVRGVRTERLMVLFRPVSKDKESFVSLSSANVYSPTTTQFLPPPTISEAGIMLLIVRLR